MGDQAVVDRKGLDALFAALRDQGYGVVGPRVRDGAIVYDEIGTSADLPEGWSDEQAPAFYRLKRRADGALFGHRPGPQSWKRFLHPPRAALWRARRGGDGISLESGEGAPRYAFVGVRPCELEAIAIQDRVLLRGEHPDPVYRARREAAFVLAVHCGEPGENCFCASLGTGPRAGAGYDLALTELIRDGRQEFLVEVGTDAGAEVLADVPRRPASETDRADARAILERAERGMGRRLETDSLPEILAARHDHPRWEETGRRCLACASCTQVCPTCFCTTVEDRTDLAGTAERVRRWDSCFTLAFSYVHGGSVRSSPASRYRQWLTHKLGAWHDQFGTAGCVGCGRCITWCPAGIDITEEVRALRGADGGG